MISTIILILAVVLFSLCLNLANIVTKYTRKSLLFSLVMIMFGDVMFALCVLYNQVNDFTILAALPFICGVILWLFSERRIPYDTPTIG